MGRIAEKDIEWVNKSEFGRRMKITPPSVAYAIDKGWIYLTPRTSPNQINWEKESQRYLRSCKSAQKRGLKANPVSTSDESNPINDKGTTTHGKTQDDLDLEDALGDTATGESMVEASTKEKVYKAKLARLDWAERAGKLISLKDAQEAVAAMAHTTKKALRSVPDRLAARMAAEMDEFKCREMMRKEIDFALDNLKYEPKPKER